MCSNLRGQMGLSEEDQKKAQQLRMQLNGKTEENVAERSSQETDSFTNSSASATSGCCQGRGNISCCQNAAAEDKIENNHVQGQETENVDAKKSSKESKSKARKTCAMPTWFESWEREDTYAAVAVVAAVASFAVAYSCYRQLRWNSPDTVELMPPEVLPLSFFYLELLNRWLARIIT